MAATPTNILAPKADSATGTRWQVDGTGEAVTDNTIVHAGVSVETPTAGGANVYVRYADSTGRTSAVRAATRAFSAGEVARLCGDATLPAGMTPAGIICTSALTDIVWSAPSLSIGGAVPLASSAHTPYATQDHVSVTYATKASLKVTDDSIKAEVSARAQTDQNVADLSSRLTQTANSLTSEISDRRSAIATVTGLANAAQSTADGAAKQANLYTIGLGDAGAVAKWIHLGTLTSNGDASSATISIVFGNGYNGRAGQNSTLTLTIKDGAQSTPSATGACGVTAMRENCDNALVDVLAQSATVYDVWVYAPWAYSNGRYSVSGQYAAWQHSGATQKAEPATSATQVKQDVAYRLADATKAQTMATENKSSIRQLSDSITSEVTERGKLAGRVGTLESTSDTHASKLEQLATSIKSLVKGESTYTDPDGASATSGIYSLVTQTRDSVTALFGQYTKTADLASTQAVKDAKKAGTDAQAAASAAQTTADSAKSTAQTAASDAATAKTNAASAVSTANSASTSAANAVETANAASSTASSASSTANSAASTANSAKSTADAAKTSAASAVSTANSASSTAGAAKSTADSLATMVRQYSGGVLVGRVGAGVCALVNADGSFDVVDVTWDGETPTIDRSDPSTEPTRASLDADSVSFIRGAANISAYADIGGHEGMATESGIDISLYGGIDHQMPAMRMTGGNIAGTGSASRNSIVLVPGSTEVDGSMTSGLVEAKGEFAVNGGPASIASGARTFSVQAGDTASAYIDDTRWANLSTDALTIDQEHVYAQYFGGYYIDLVPTVLFTGSYDYTKGHGITLSEPASNFYLMTIVCQTNDGTYTSQTVHDPNGKKVSVLTASAMSGYVWLKAKVYLIDGTSIDTFRDGNGNYWLSSATIQNGDSVVTTGGNTDLGIVKVIGWRKGGQR